jgi:hypothetical protein
MRFKTESRKEDTEPILVFTHPTQLHFQCSVDRIEACRLLYLFIFLLVNLKSRSAHNLDLSVDGDSDMGFRGNRKLQSR